MGNNVKIKVRTLSPEEFTQGIRILKTQIKELRSKQVESWKEEFKSAWKQDGSAGKWREAYEKCEAQIQKRKAAITKMMSEATPTQRKIVENSHRKKTIIVGLGVVVALVAVLNVSNAIKISEEEKREYYINIADEFILDCGAVYDEATGAIKCDEQRIMGEYSNYESVELKNDAGEIGKNWKNKIWKADVAYASEISTGVFSAHEGRFEKRYSEFEVKKDEYQTEKYSREEISRKYNFEATEEFTLYNNVLDRNVVNKKIKVKRQFSGEDLALIDQKNNEWRVAEAERKAAEEAARAAEEAAKAAAAAQAEAERQAATQSRDQSSTGSSSNSSSRSYSPNSGVKDVVSGYCNDGTYVTGNPSARGAANACYGHKGWRDY